MNEIIQNKNNWYIAEILEECVSKKPDETNNVVWGNYHLIQAKSISEAYEKAVKIGKEGEFEFTNENNKEMRWVFLGIGELLPIYEDIEDGAEIMWTNYGALSKREIHKILSSKEAIFDKLNIN